MVQPSPPGNLYIHVGRDMWGGKAFLSGVAGLASEELGGTTITAAQYLEFPDFSSLADTDSPIVARHVPLTQPDVEITRPKELEMVLFHATADSGFPLKQTPRVIATQVEQVTKRPLKRRLRAEQHQDWLLTTALSRLACDMAFREQGVSDYQLEGQIIIYDRITRLPYPGEDKIFGLMPAAGQFAVSVLRRQANIIRTRVNMIDSDFADQALPVDLEVPFIRISKRQFAEEPRVRLFIEKLRKKCLPLSLQVGEVTVDSSRTAATSIQR